ncbi:hypothetical protein [Actinoplanes sp. NPDC049265]|uniref:hypothetical protein n=1 Tax=Actinoplanes sp. NPDC049265 TaxID=3363902 RepID=UPI00371C438B
MNALTEQLTLSADLAGRYSAAMRDLPGHADRLRHLRDEHISHLIALLDQTCAGPAQARDAGAVLRELRELEDTAALRAGQACLAAPDAEAILLGTIAAALAAHGEALT